MALALSLHAAGITEVEVYEARRRVRELGVGINVLPHAVRELTELGLLDDAPARHPHHRGRRTLRRTASDLGRASRTRRRLPLAAVLHPPRRLPACSSAPSSRGSVPTRVDTRPPSCSRRPTAGSSASSRPRRRRAPARHEADVLVGVRRHPSAVRTQLVPDEGPPLWNGVTMWRGVTAAEPFLTGRTMVLAGARGRRSWPTRSRRRGRGRADQLGGRGAPRRRTTVPPQDWDHQAASRRSAAASAPSRFDWLDVPALVDGAERAASTRWSTGTRCRGGASAA